MGPGLAAIPLSHIARRQPFEIGLSFWSGVDCFSPGEVCMAYVLRLYPDRQDAICVLRAIAINNRWTAAVLQPSDLVHLWVTLGGE